MTMGEGSLNVRWHRVLPLAVVERLIRWSLAGIFLYSGLVKLADPAGFATVIAGFGLLLEEWVYPAALLLPALEVVAGTGIFLRCAAVLLSSPGCWSCSWLFSSTASIWGWISTAAASGPKIRSRPTKASMVPWQGMR